MLGTISYFTIITAILAHLAYSASIEVKDDTISTDETRTRFLLWTRQNPSSYQELMFEDLQSVVDSNFNASLKTKVLVHGYTGGGAQSWVIRMKAGFLEKEDCNVISVDWAPLAGPAPWYGVAVANARKVGARAGQYLAFLKENLGLSYEDVHVLGFSLGGQLVAFIGQELNGVLPRITGLDPAGFLYHTAPADEKLTPDDAQFVDVIHSGGLWIGTDEPVGHIDFYPNHGQAPQPGCEGEEPWGFGCSHERAPNFFSESINSDIGFVGVECDSWENFEAGLCVNNQQKLMGYPADITNQGKTYYLRTNAESPYAQG